MSTPRYLKKQGDPDSIIHIYTDGLFARGDMVEVFPQGIEPKAETVVIAPTIVPDSAAPQVTDPVVLPPVTDDRTGQIRAAILAVPVENYSQSVGKRPAMPKVGDVAAITGFKVSAVEIAEIMTSIQG